MRFAHLKVHHGFERMRLRGLTGARDEFPTSRSRIRPTGTDCATLVRAPKTAKRIELADIRPPFLHVV
jgi:hypothetical protein